MQCNALFLPFLHGLVRNTLSAITCYLCNMAVFPIRVLFLVLILSYIRFIVMALLTPPSSFLMLWSRAPPDNSSAFPWTWHGTLRRMPYWRLTSNDQQVQWQFATVYDTLHCMWWYYIAMIWSQIESRNGKTFSGVPNMIYLSLFLQYYIQLQQRQYFQLLLFFFFWCHCIVASHT